ncbi:MAG: patatin-like phospholipase family protein [Tenericutes bacterium]|nr:patatin-like phospholipase family protein [Mycoplasmatota bacterium]
MKLGLCFSGGGSRGAYQVGACMALKEAGLLDLVDAYSGTSIGSVNAALTASIPIETIRDIWFDMPKDIFETSEKLFKRLRSERTKLAANGLYTINQLEMKLKTWLDIKTLKQKEVYVTISCSGAKGGGVMSLLKTSYKHYLRKDKQVIYTPIWKEAENDIYKLIIASCSIPVLFPPTIIDGKQYYDGGIYDNVPVKPLVKAGCGKIIVIHLDKLPHFYVKKYPDVSFFALKPKHSLGWYLNFTEDNAHLRYHQGYEEMHEFLKNNKII